MPDLINVIKETVSPEGPFGFNTGIRTRGLSQCNEYDQLPDEDKTLINQVRRGKKVELLLYFKNELLLFEHKEAGVALPEEDNKKIGYQVYRYHLSKKNVKDVKDVKDVKGDSSSISFYQQSRMFWLFIGMAIILMGSLGVLMYKINNFDTELKNIASRVDNVSTQLNTEKIANSVATKVPDALKDKGVTTEIIDALNLKRINIKEGELSKLIATELSEKSAFVDKLATETADKIPPITDVTEKLNTWVSELSNFEVGDVVNKVANRIIPEGNNTIAVKDIENAVVKELAGNISSLEQFKMGLELASKFEKNDNGTWKLKLGSSSLISSCSLSYYNNAQNKRIKCLISEMGNMNISIEKKNFYYSPKK